MCVMSLLTPSTEDLVGPQPSHTSPQLFYALDQLSEAYNV